jgi:hypothetical protein
MKSLFDKESFEEINNRLDRIDDLSVSQWGKMDVSQMFAHCCEPLKIALGIKDSKQEHYLKKLILSLFKHKMYDDSEWKKNLPTPDQFKISDKKKFDLELNNHKSLIENFHLDKNKTEWPKHPMFGIFTSEQWGKMQYKHINHHLKQFGV